MKLAKQKTDIIIHELHKIYKQWLTKAWERQKRPKSQLVEIAT